MPYDYQTVQRQMNLDGLYAMVNGLDRIHGIVQGLLRLSHTPTGRTDHCDVNGSLRDASRFAAMDEAW